MFEHFINQASVINLIYSKQLVLLYQCWCELPSCWLDLMPILALKKSTLFCISLSLIWSPKIGPFWQKFSLIFTIICKYRLQLSQNCLYEIYKRLIKTIFVQFNPVSAKILSKPGIVFTTLHFLRNLQIGPIS
jgi:hypothetical protein